MEDGGVNGAEIGATPRKEQILLSNGDSCDKLVAKEANNELNSSDESRSGGSDKNEEADDEDDPSRDEDDPSRDEDDPSRDEDSEKAELRKKINAQLRKSLENVELRDDDWRTGLGDPPAYPSEAEYGGGAQNMKDIDDGTDALAEDLSPKKVPKKRTDFNRVDFGLCIFSTVLYLLDYGVNILMFQKYFNLHKHHTAFVAYFWLTFVFVISTSLVTMVFEVVWYIDEKDKFGKGLSWSQWLVRIIFLVTLLGPAFRYFEVLHYAYTNLKKKLEPQEKETIVRKSMEMKADADFFYMLEKFTESGLHLVLQMYIVKRELANEEDEELIGVAEALKITFAIILMPYTVTVYCRSQRQSKPHANDMTFTATTVQFFSRLFIIVSQAAALSLFLAMYPLIFVVLILIHYWIMVVWVFVQDTKFCKWLWLECVYRFFTAFIYLFNYFNVNEGKESYYKALAFYSYIFLERGLMMCFWCQEDVNVPNVYRWPVLLGYFILFFLGISIKVYYYTYHHPTRKPPTDVHRKILALPKRVSKNTGQIDGTELMPMNRPTQSYDSEV